MFIIFQVTSKMGSPSCSTSWSATSRGEAKRAGWKKLKKDLSSNRLQATYTGWCSAGPVSIKPKPFWIILCSIKRGLQMQFSLACKFSLFPLCRYNEKHIKCIILILAHHGWRKQKNTNSTQTNILWIYSPLLHHIYKWSGGIYFNICSYFWPNFIDCVIFKTTISC